MNAREKLNVIFLSGAILFALFGGLSCQSWPAVFVILIILIVIGLGQGSLRL